MFTIEDLVTVYAKRCVEIGRKLNLTTVENIDEALIIAKQYDVKLIDMLNKGQEVPPLFGIPLSIKDNVSNMKLI